MNEISQFPYGISILEITYVLTSVLFIVGLKMLSHPLTARRGNILAATGMILAVVATILLHEKDGQPVRNIGLILAAIVIGTVIGWIISRKVRMTAMPQLVSFFNGMGGAAAAIISMLEFPLISNELVERTGMANGQVLIILLGLIIGTISWAGSMIAFGKLDGWIGDMKNRSMIYVNLGILALLLGSIVFIMTRDVQSSSELQGYIYVIFAMSVIYGVLFVMPIGGADMPVVISLLNSFTGVAAAMGGFLYNNQAMLTGGILVGSAGTILTILMCRAMNRSLLNVLVGVFGATAQQNLSVAGSIREITISDAAVLLSYSRKVVIVPGYGLAVARAQHICHELDKLLDEKGVEVKYAIHPVAGRMPGHMNVLLAEADVPYEQLFESDEINPELPNTDVLVVIGANDVVNPAAEDDPSSPIYGMPVVKARDAKNIIVMKRGMGKGYAAIENMLFYNSKTRMLFGDAKVSLQNLVNEVKSL
ncbi:MAG: NAD(P)(+) transhydrogenase (Re/Si-specific) subunit beta [Bacteroidales bacterium]|jgi:NAD(P) transhydrogenase subunit beta